MVGSFADLGKPGGTTILDLTLGVDRDGDGIPDSWEEALLNALGYSGGPADIDPDADADGDGLSNLDEYYSGNYGFDSNDGLALRLEEYVDGVPVVEWLAIRGRRYSVQSSADMENWAPISFQLADDEQGFSYADYQADELTQVRARLLVPEEPEPAAFFRLLLH